MEKHYIFGYGSLINKESRQQTSPSSLKAIPVKIKNYTRGWFARTGVTGLSTTFLGCMKNDSKILIDNEKSAFVNGVLYQVEKDELPMLDKRERLYTRSRVKIEDIQNYGSELPSTSVVWIYTNDFKNRKDFLKALPNKDFPIIQSYVDLCLNGCYEIEEDFSEARKQGFSEEFIKTTIYWNDHWANDRIYPRRPHIYCKNAFKIDEQLYSLLPNNIFSKIYIE